jgi:hypothetical protein
MLDKAKLNNGEQEDNRDEPHSAKLSNSEKTFKKRNQ